MWVKNKQNILILCFLNLYLLSSLDFKLIAKQEYQFLIQQHKEYAQSMPAGVSPQAFFDKLEGMYRKNNTLQFISPLQSIPFKIPHIIHLIWFNSDIQGKRSNYLPRLEQCHLEWKNQHPDWDIVLWDAELVEENFPEKLFNQKIYDEARAMSDYPTMSKIVRYEILHKFGGLFIEPNLKCLKSFNQLHEQYDFYVGFGKLKSYGAISNSLIGSRTGHPIIKACMEKIKQGDGPLPDDKYSMGNWMMRHLATQPLTQAVYEKADQENNIDIVFPQRFFNDNVFAKEIFPITLINIPKYKNQRYYIASFFEDASSLEFITSSSQPPQQKPMVIFIASYNNRSWYKRNLTSIFMQNYDNYRIIYVDDASRDGTGDLVEKYIKEHHLKDKVTLIKNKKNQGGLANLYHAAQLCHDDEIMVHLDGDDWFAHENALAVLNKVYDNPQVWMTYGQFQFYPYPVNPAVSKYCKEFPREVITKNLFRQYPWWISHHLKTCYTRLFKAIKKEDLQLKGKFIPSAWDGAFMFPMLEMAGNRIKCIPHFLYVYNQANPINDNKANAALQGECATFIRSLPSYQRLLSRPEKIE